jgi:hypothetical protein
LQHPSFPRKQWDLADWTIPNQARGDSPARATLWSLGATRVAGKPGTGRFIFGDPSAAVFIGFANDPMPIDLSQSNIRIESMGTPFATITVVPAATGRHIADADRLLIAAVARAQNTGTHWDAGRPTVGKNWGSAPVQIEVVSAVISLPGEWKHAMALDASGKPTGKELTESLGDRTVVHLGGMPALCYEVSR